MSEARTAEIAAAAHDLNNICTAMHGFAVLALPLAPADSPLANFLEEIVQAAARGTALAARLNAACLDSPGPRPEGRP